MMKEKVTGLKMMIYFQGGKEPNCGLVTVDTTYKYQCNKCLYVRVHRVLSSEYIAVKAVRRPVADLPVEKLASYLSPYVYR